MSSTARRPKRAFWARGRNGRAGYELSFYRHVRVNLLLASASGAPAGDGVVHAPSEPSYHSWGVAAASNEAPPSAVTDLGPCPQDSI
jgi:hypothetical protein